MSITIIPMAGEVEDELESGSLPTKPEHWTPEALEQFVVGPRRVRCPLCEKPVWVMAGLGFMATFHELEESMMLVPNGDGLWEVVRGQVEHECEP